METNIGNELPGNQPDLNTRVVESSKYYFRTSQREAGA